jgi:hypothetical protein
MRPPRTPTAAAILLLGSAVVPPAFASVSVLRIRGRVVDDVDDSPVRRLAVLLLGGGLRGGQTVSDQKGEFDLEVRGGSGTFAWAVAAEGFDPRGGVVHLRGDADFGLVRLPRATAVVEGSVFGPEGLPLAGARVERHGPLMKWQPPRSCLRSDPSDPAASNVAADTTTDEEGRFRFERVPKGRGFVRVLDPRAPAAPPLEFEARAFESPWLEFHPLVGYLRAEILPAQGEWQEPFTLSLREGRRRASWRLVPPTQQGGFGGGSFGSRIGCSLQQPGEVLLRACGPEADILPAVDEPGVTYKGSERDVEVSQDGDFALIRNVPAGTWIAEVANGRGRAAAGTVVVVTGGETAFTVAVP